MKNDLNNLEEGQLLIAYKKEGKVYAQIQNLKSKEDFDDMAFMGKEGYFSK